MWAMTTRRGIPLEKAHRIAVLLSRNLRRADIAKECRVGRDTVYRIRNRTHWSCREGAPAIRRCKCGLLVHGKCLKCQLATEEA